ncbi:MAG: SAM-dependent methyltransferase [Pseudomonadota bacterium]
MPIKYNDVVLWGHSYQEYIQMFALGPEDLNKNIINCRGGPATFNAMLSKQGGKVISTDPLFALPFDKMKQEIDQVFTNMLKVLKKYQDRFVWKTVTSPDELAKRRYQDIKDFLQDFPEGKKAGRYQGYRITELPYAHDSFDLALCSHYLFSNCPDQSMEYHVKVIEKMAYIAKEVRIFPLLDSQGEIPELVGPVIQKLHETEHGVEIKAVPYEFQQKGNAMLKVWLQVCEVKS